MPSDASALEKGIATDDAVFSSTSSSLDQHKADDDSSLADMRLRSLQRGLLPTFWFAASQGNSSRKLSRTAYLDGLRGFAALLVYWSHHQSWGHDKGAIFESAYGYNDNRHFIQLPAVRMFFSGGHFAVAVFFVISGYVLSTKPLVLIAQKEFVKLEEYLASAVFRRWIRLYLPIIGTSLAFAAWWHIFGTRVFQPEPTILGEIWTFYDRFRRLSWDWRVNWHMWFRYNFHMWTIPVEYRGSLYVWTSLIAFSRTTENMRLVWTVCSIIYTLCFADGWYLALFITGMLIADLDLRAQRGTLPGFFEYLRPFKSQILFLMFCASLFLSGVPSDEKSLPEQPGWRFLSHFVPEGLQSWNPDSKWFFHFFAATFMVVCCHQFTWLKSFFELPFNQYLGKISYALYLVHGPVLWVIADTVFAIMGWQIPESRLNAPRWTILPAVNLGPLGMEFNFLLSHLIILPVTLWVAELCTKAIDEPSVRCSHWLYKKLTGAA